MLPEYGGLGEKLPVAAVLVFCSYFASILLVFRSYFACISLVFSLLSLKSSMMSNFEQDVELRASQIQTLKKEYDLKIRALPS